MGTYLGTRRILRLANRQRYFRKVLKTEPDSLIGFWRQNETSGSTAVDWSPEGNDGSYTGVTLADAKFLSGAPVPFFDGTNDYNDTYSAAFNTDFDDSEITILAWLKVANAGVWTDSTERYAIQLRVSDNNRIAIQRHTTNNRLRGFYIAGGAYKIINSDGMSSTDWICSAITCSVTNDELKLFMNGSQVGSTATSLGTWAGDLIVACIGAANTTPDNVWNGWLGPCAVWSTPLTPAQVAYVSTV